MALCVTVCNGMMDEFLLVCHIIRCPISKDKTERAGPVMTCLGVLLDGDRHLLILPNEKRHKALSFLNYSIAEKKVTIKFVQQLTGILNFIM